MAKKKKVEEINPEDLLVAPEDEQQPEPVEEVAPVEEIAPEPSMTVGDYLREAREAKNLTIKIISQNTKISTTLLEFLETNQLKMLPDRAYVIGFIKSYCKTVGADERAAINYLDDTYEAQNLREKPVVEEVQEPEENMTEPLIKAGLAVLGVVIFFVIVFNIGDDEPKKAEKKPEPIKAQSVSASTPLQPTVSPVVEEKKEVEVKKEAPKVAEKKPEPVPTKAPVVAEKKEVEVKKEEEKKKPKRKINFRSMNSPLFQVRNDSDEDVQKYIPSQFRNSLVSGMQNIFIKATDGDTWITYKSDDKPIKKFVLKQDRSILIRGNEVRIFLGNIHAAKVFLNNKLLSISSNSGVKSLVFPEVNKRKYKLPLFIYQENGKVMASDEYIQSQENIN